MLFSCRGLFSLNVTTSMSLSASFRCCFKLGSDSRFPQEFRLQETSTKRVAHAVGPHKRAIFVPLASMASSASRSAAEPIKLATYVTRESEEGVGVIRDGKLWPIKQMVGVQKNCDFSHMNNMIDVIHCWQFLCKLLEFEGPCIALDDVNLLAPIPKPTGAIMCVGKNYIDHVKEVDTWKAAPGISSPDIPKYPIIFTKAPQSVIGPGAAIKYPSDITSQVDYETELAVVIGKAGRGIKREDAMSHIFGYTILNDVTARDLQKRHQQWFLGKSCDTFCPMGPWIVPETEINGQDLQIQCWINDELRQDSRTSKMIFSIPELIESISSGITLQPGDIIATGTPSGVGSGFNPPKHLLPGNTVRMKIEGIGELINRVI